MLSIQRSLESCPRMASVSFLLSHPTPSSGGCTLPAVHFCTALSAEGGRGWGLAFIPATTHPEGHDDAEEEGVRGRGESLQIFLPNPLQRASER